MLCMCVSDDVSSAMQSVAELAAEPLPPRSAVDNDSEASRHIVDHFNGHRILKRLICNDVDRLKHSPETGKSLTSLSFLFYSACRIRSAAVSWLLFILKTILSDQLSQSLPVPDRSCSRFAAVGPTVRRYRSIHAPPAL